MAYSVSQSAMHNYACYIAHIITAVPIICFSGKIRWSAGPEPQLPGKPACRCGEIYILQPDKADAPGRYPFPEPYLKNRPLIKLLLGKIPDDT